MKFKSLFFSVVALALILSACSKETDYLSIDQKAISNQQEFKSWFGTDFNGSGTVIIAEGITLTKKGNETWLRFEAGYTKGELQIAVKSGNSFELFTWDTTFDGLEDFFFDGKKYSNLKYNFVGAVPVAEPVAVNLGFIGYYLYDGNALSTSFYWQALTEGDMIDWDAVDAAYAEWVGQGGLAPDRTLWQTSGYASFTFEDYAAIGYGDFTEGQLEGYYLEYYVDPGYVLPVSAPVMPYKLYAYIYDPYYTSTYSKDVTLGDEVDWDAIYAAYADNFYESEFAAKVTEDNVIGWNYAHTVLATDNPDGPHFDGAKPDITLAQDMFLLYGETEYQFSIVPVLKPEPVIEPVTVVGFGVDCSGLIIAQGGNNKKDVTIPIVNFMSDGTQEPLFTFFKAGFNFQNDDTQKYPFTVDGIDYELIIKVRNNSIVCNNISVEKK